MTTYATEADIPTGTHVASAIDLRRGSVIVGWLTTSDRDVPSDMTGTVDEVGHVRPGERIEITVEGWTDEVYVGAGFVVKDRP